MRGSQAGAALKFPKSSFALELFLFLILTSITYGMQVKISHCVLEVDRCDAETGMV